MKYFADCFRHDWSPWSHAAMQEALPHDVLLCVFVVFFFMGLLPHHQNHQSLIDGTPSTCRRGTPRHSFNQRVEWLPLDPSKRNTAKRNQNSNVSETPVCGHVHLEYLCVSQRGTPWTSEWIGYLSTPVKETPRKETKTTRRAPQWFYSTFEDLLGLLEDRTGRAKKEKNNLTYLFMFKQSVQMLVKQTRKNVNMCETKSLRNYCQTPKLETKVPNLKNHLL